MNCEKASEHILAGTDGGAGLEAHLAQCPECASLSRQWTALRSIKGDLKAPAGPPRDTDLRIRSAAIARAHELRRRRGFFKVSMYFMAAAAMLALSVSLTFAILNGDGASTASHAQDLAKAASAAPRFSGAQAISWDSVELADGLLNLSSDIESVSSALGSSKRPSSQPSSSDQEDSVPKISVEIPDLAT